MKRETIRQINRRFEMCKFFSFCGDGNGNYLYMNWQDRQANETENCDSHTFILTHHGIPPEKQELWSLYEYDPMNHVFTVDVAVGEHDHEAARNWVEARDWSTIVEPLVIQPIVSPFDVDHGPVTQTDIDLLREWAKIGDRIWDTVRVSIGNSVGTTIRASIWSSVCASVCYSVCSSVWASVRDSSWSNIGANIWDNIADSIGCSIMGYFSSFFNIEYDYDLSSIVTLWKSGLAPSYDGSAWRLHAGKNAEIVYEMKEVCS
jgi:hypothetical protein